MKIKVITRHAPSNYGSLLQAIATVKVMEGMGHDSEKTTQIYLASLDNALVDKANTQILRDLL